MWSPYSRSFSVSPYTVSIGTLCVCVCVSVRFDKLRVPVRHTYLLLTKCSLLYNFKNSFFLIQNYCFYSGEMINIISTDFSNS